MKNYSTLIFDAFDTVIHIDRKQLPEHRVGERIMHTTASKVHPVYEEEAGPLAFEDFLNAFRGSFAEANRRRQADFREIPSADRFRIMLELLGKDIDAFSPDFPERLARSHMENLQSALEIRPENYQFLEWASRKEYRLAMISNWDYAPTLYYCLDRYGVRDMFEAVVVSDEVGWRKPHPHIFEHAFKELRIPPVEALFVGDRLEIDVDGAAGSGMDAAWIDTGQQEWSPEHATPRFRIGSLPELVPILEESEE